jgi:DNA-binding MarR family transcriptional regulator
MSQCSGAPSSASDSSDPAGCCRFYDRDAYRHDRSVGFLLRLVTTSLQQHIDRRLAHHDLTNALWLPLFKIAKGECDTLAALARDMALDPGAMTRTLDRLEAKGLVQRERSQADRRVVKLVLTAAGREVADQVRGVVADVLNAHLEGFSNDDWQLLVQLLERMLANGEALRAAPPFLGESQP